MCDVSRAFDQKQPKETLITHEELDWPWAKFGAALFTYKGQNYLICVDYYSSFWEINPLDNTTSGSVVRKVKVAVYKALNPGDVRIRQRFSVHTQLNLRNSATSGSLCMQRALKLTPKAMER